CTSMFGLCVCDVCFVGFLGSCKKIYLSLVRCQATEAVPRARGDGPRDSISAAVSPYCFPHMRGWTLGCTQGLAVQALLPAHAGMDFPKGGAGPTLTGVIFKNYS